MNDTPKADVELVTSSRAQTEALGEAIAELAEPGEVIALTGPLGAGKTQFVRGLARGLGADDRLVSSPTFVLMQEYPGRLTVIHIDAYRIRDLSDLESMGWNEELLEGAVVAVEWAEKIGDQLPDDCLVVEFDHLPGEDQRLIQITLRGRWAEHRASLQAFAADLEKS